MQHEILKKSTIGIMKRIQPLTKKLWIAVLLFIVLIIGSVTFSSDELLIVSIIGLVCTLIFMVMRMNYYYAVSHGSDKAIGWAIGSLLGLMTIPIGAIIYSNLQQSSLGNYKDLGFCSGCNFRVSYKLGKCPFCGANFR